MLLLKHGKREEFFLKGFFSRFQIFKRKEVEKVEKNLERKMLVAQAALRIEDTIRDFARAHGDILKSMGVDVKEAQLLALDIFGEAYEALKTKVQQTQARIRRE